MEIRYLPDAAETHNRHDSAIDDEWPSMTTGRERNRNVMDSVYALEQVSRMHVARLRLEGCLPCRVRALVRRT